MSHYLESPPADLLVEDPLHPLRFFAASEPVKNAPGTWNSARISVMDRLDAGPGGSRKVGEYVRNYSDALCCTFAPFVRDGEWYALYSPRYTATRIMRLPTLEDIGGEETVPHGFCPVELWVPRFRRFSFDSSGKRLSFLSWHQPHEEDSRSGQLQAVPDRMEAEAWKWSSMGFVAGCHWGDDSSWKIEAFDLRRAAEGVIRRFQPFGYREMGADSLSAAMELDDLDAEGTGTIRIKTLTPGHAEWPDDTVPSGTKAGDEAPS